MHPGPATVFVAGEAALQAEGAGLEVPVPDAQHREATVDVGVAVPFCAGEVNGKLVALLSAMGRCSRD